MARKNAKGSGSLWRRGNIWWIVYSGPNGGFRESTGETNKGAAQAALVAKIAQFQAGTATGKTQRTTVADLYGYVVADYAKNNRKSVRVVHVRWNTHLAPFFGKLRAQQVSTNTVEKYIEKRLSEKASHASINRELAILSRGFRLGYQRRTVAHIPHFATLKEAKPRDGFLDADQYQRLAEACANAKGAPWLRVFFEVAGQLSNRRGELLNLRVRDIDFDQRVFILPDTKNGEKRTVPMTLNVRSLLEITCGGKPPDAFVFTWPDGSQVRDFRALWTKVTTDAGVPWLKVHDLRRTGIRNMRRRGIDEQTAMRISGHKTVSVFRRYNIIDEHDLQNAAKLIEEGRSNSQYTDTAQLPKETLKMGIN